MTITEEALAGQWYYLEEEEPLTERSPYWTLRDGIVSDGADGDAIGTYALTGGAAVLDVQFPGGGTREIRISAPAGSIVTSDTQTLNAGGLDVIPGIDHPVAFWGALVRRSEDDEATDAMHRELSGS